MFTDSSSEQPVVMFNDILKDQSKNSGGFFLHQYIVRNKISFESIEHLHYIFIYMK